MESKITTEMTAIMREADQAFETVGGSTRHYVRDVLLPLMEQKGYAIVKKDERQPASRIPLTPGAPTTTGTYFASIKSFAGYTDEMVVLHHQADKGVYYAYGQFSRPVNAEDIIGHVAVEGHGMGEAYDELRASHRLMSRAYADALIERDEARRRAEKIEKEHADLNLALAAMLNGYQNLSMYQRDWFTVPKDLIGTYTKMVLEYEPKQKEEK